MYSLTELRGQNIAILGAGREGRSAWRWLRRHLPGQSLSIYDEHLPRPDDFDDALTTWVHGAFDEKLLATHDVLLRSPGVSPYRSALASARAQGVRVTTPGSLWFAQHGRANTLVITGTKGKSTTAALTAHLLKAAGASVQLAGNIGVPLLDCEANPDWWVIELSSYQLLDLEARPGMAAILNISDEHLDWHGGRAAYQRDKLRLAKLLKGRPLLLNHADDVLRETLAAEPNIHWFNHPQGFEVRDDTLWYAGQPVPAFERSQLPGAHNLANLAAALSLLKMCGIGCADLNAALAGFRGLPHRLQSLGSVDGVEYVSDSLSTTPFATVAALRAFAGRRVILLVGGLDRGLDWRPWMPHMKQCPPHALVCLPDNGPQIAACAAEAGFVPSAGVHLAEDLAQGMGMAQNMAEPGDCILLSPGAPSFPQFRDFAHRGAVFAALAGVPETAKETADTG